MCLWQTWVHFSCISKFNCKHFFLHHSKLLPIVGGWAEWLVNYLWGDIKIHCNTLTIMIIMSIVDLFMLCNILFLIKHEFAVFRFVLWMRLCVLLSRHVSVVSADWKWPMNVWLLIMHPQTNGSRNHGITELHISINIVLYFAL